MGVKCIISFWTSTERVLYSKRRIN